MYETSVSGTIQEAFSTFWNSDDFRKLPLKVQIAFLKIFDWLPPREKSVPLALITAASATMLRNRAARERGWRAANHALVLIQILSARAVDAGALPMNRVKSVSKLPPPVRATSDRRRIPPARGLPIAPVQPMRKTQLGE